MGKTNHLVALVLAGLLVGASLQSRAADTRWVGTWGCGIQLTEPRNLPPAPELAGNTFRQIVHSSIGGKELRIHFSNIFGESPVEMKSVHIALNPSAIVSSTIDPATDKALKFGGSESVTIPAGIRRSTTPGVYSCKSTHSYSLRAL